MKNSIFPALALLSACSSGPVPPEWQSNSRSALDSFQQRYLRGDTAGADAEFARAKSELSSTGNASMVARAELLRCAVRAASLEFDNCPGFENLRADAGVEELAYAEFLTGKSERKVSDDPLSRLVSHGVKLNSGRASPENISAAIEISSSQGWRRPLLAWLGVEEKRAESAGDRAALERIRRRIALASGKS
ncbi:MAG: hypothetical protein H7Y16_08540 [Candidatus Parcubacteria bacterium]|nr:hypothetical protein [Burkholderiales bacterium]